MSPSGALIATVVDVERIERTPLAEQFQADSTYDLLQQSAAQFGDRDALVFVPKGSPEEPPFAYSHAEVLRRVTQAANLFQRLGVGPADVVAYVLPNLPQAHFALWGGEAAGIACAINPMLEARHLAEILRTARARVLVTLGPGPDGELWDKIASSVPGTSPVISTPAARRARRRSPGTRMPTRCSCAGCRCSTSTPRSPPASARSAAGPPCCSRASRAIALRGCSPASGG